MKKYSNFELPKKIKRFDSRYNKTNVSYYFKLNSLSLLYPYAKLFLSIKSIALTFTGFASDRDRGPMK
jgi:hypothetical protein